MEKKLATVLSFLLHPAFAPLFPLLILFILLTFLSLITSYWKQRIILITALGTVLIPFSLLPLFYFRKLTDQVHLGKHRDRFYFYFSVPFRTILHIIPFSALLSQISFRSFYFQPQSQYL